MVPVIGEWTGTGRGQRAPERVHCRDGYRDWMPGGAAGIVEPRIRKLPKGTGVPVPPLAATNA